jgi:hypothetical protein
MKRLLLSTNLAAAILTPSLGDEVKVPLFNGTDFTGWKIVSDPKKTAIPSTSFHPIGWRHPYLCGSKNRD